MDKDGLKTRTQLGHPRQRSPRIRRHVCMAVLMVGASSWLSGCSFYRDAMSGQRLDQGMTIVLPGIEGESFANGNIARGLESGEVPTAIRIYDWTTGFAPLAILHLRDSARHRAQAKKLAEEIVHYQLLYPGRPVYLVGHSGGGAMSLLTLEALPRNHRVTGVFLLAAAISPEYDVESALSRTEYGIWNFYSPLDATFLIAGTSLAGTVDGRWEASAGAFGFKYDDQPTGASGPRLTQVPYRPEMLLSQNPGGHLGPTFPGFVRKYVAPEIVGMTREKTDRRILQETSRAHLAVPSSIPYAPDGPEPQSTPYQRATYQQFESPYRRRE